MDTGILWSLIGSFTNVFILTRVLQYLFKRTNLEDKKRAYLVFFIVASIDIIGLYFFFHDIRLALHGWLFYYLPFLVMWLLKDLMEASRKKREQEASAKE